MESPVTVSVKKKDSTPAIGPTRRRVQQHILKKHIQQKYLLCGFAIHAFIASPAYLYGIVVDSNYEWVMRIWPPIIYQAIGQICQSILLHTAEKCNGYNHPEDENRKVILCATFIIFLAITICGCLFSSAWLTISTTTQVIAVIVYGLFGGIGSSLIMLRTHMILESVRPQEDKYVRKTIHICGEAFCQLFLSFVFTSIRTLYGTAQALFLMASMLINLIPLALLITRNRDDILQQKRDDLLLTRKIPSAAAAALLSTTSDHHRFDGLQSLSQTLTRSNPNLFDHLDGIEFQQKFWKNPLRGTSPNLNEIHCNYMAVDQEDTYMAYINSNGVEIMEIIPEEDENISTVRSSTVTIDRHSRISVEILQTNKEFNAREKYFGRGRNEKSSEIEGRITCLRRCRQIYNYMKKFILRYFLELAITPMKRALGIFKLYPATFLQSTDIFSYVMCLTVLPGIAISQHNLKFAEIPFLFSLLAFPWMCFSLMTPRFGYTLVKKKLQWHIFGCIAKALALICISFSQSKLLLSVSSVLLGFGQAVTLFLQDLAMKGSMSLAQWSEVKYPMHSMNGLLIIAYGGLAHLIVLNFGFQASICFGGGIYTVSVILWFLVLLFDKN